MVKRQTVWLSTMMVLSLMLIGYYTMNNGVQTTSNSGTAGSPGSTVTTVTPPAGSSTTSGTSTLGGSTATQTGSSATTTGSGNSGSSPSQSASPSASDWFVTLQTQVDQELSRQEDVYSQIISSTNATANQMTQAEEQLKQLETLIGQIGNAKDAVMGEGYKAVVIIPDLKTNQATVYVKTSTLSASDAVKVMNIVSQNLNVPINNVIVNKHS
ncbi:MAG: hypothetical protein A2201_02520 [Alicyclobacillus sp. RIFOXYA1_FULL_53_8]|nr:MAG: hypothetical protein A2201_02520 [Alicyclobacillus sp. RIFOXYA1_FULL_53_8]